VFELSGGKRRQRGLISESRGPCGKCRDRRVVRKNRRVNLHHITLIKLKNLADIQACLGMFKCQACGSAEVSFRGGDIKRRAQFISERLVVSPEGERISV